MNRGMDSDCIDVLTLQRKSGDSSLGWYCIQVECNTITGVHTVFDAVLRSVGAVGSILR